MSLIYEVKGLFEQRTDLVSKHDSWEEIELEKVVKIQNGYPFKSELFNSEGKGFPLIRIRDILRGESETFFNGDYPIEFIVRNGDLIIGMDGDFNSDLWKGNDALLNQRVCRLIPNEKYILKKFVAYGIGGYLKVINENTSSTTVKHLSSKSIGEIPFPLPPLPTQHRIVAKLDTLFGHLDALKTRLDRIPQLLKAFRQSVLTQAVTGKLTGNLTKWHETDLVNLLIKGGIFDGPFGSDLKTIDYTETGIRVVRLENIDHLNFIEEKETFVSEEKYESLKRHSVGEGDIIFSSFITEEIRACILPKLNTKAIAKADCFCIRPNVELVDKKFLLFFLVSLKAYNRLILNIHGATRPRINTTQLKTLKVSLPSLEEQQEIVRRVESLFAKADRIESQYQNLKAKIEQLPQALLAKAFRGELAEQLPEDGDARELLETIRQAQSLDVKKMKGETGERKPKTGRILRGGQDDTALRQVAEPEEKYGKYKER